MKKATIIHLEKVTQYFKEGMEVTPSANEKLINAIFPSMETKVTEFRTELEVVKLQKRKGTDCKILGSSRTIQKLDTP